MKRATTCDHPLLFSFLWVVCPASVASFAASRWALNEQRVSIDTEFSRVSGNPRSEAVCGVSIIERDFPSWDALLRLFSALPIYSVLTQRLYFIIQNKCKHLEVRTRTKSAKGANTRVQRPSVKTTKKKDRPSVGLAPGRPSIVSLL